MVGYAKIDKAVDYFEALKICVFLFFIYSFVYSLTVFISFLLDLVDLAFFGLSCYHSTEAEDLCEILMCHVFRWMEFMMWYFLEINRETYIVISTNKNFNMSTRIWVPVELVEVAVLLFLYFCGNNGCAIACSHIILPLFAVRLLKLWMCN